ncbi:MULTISPECIES: ABC transporter ATP-binding protein [unclassified Mesotoga]|uniref:ABC transporter ATP-binding protein n=4 Tax=Mesotoga TaxID=1184396 RepID=UPI000FF7D882|nr:MULTISPECIES: ABC transporter ATP-binding protein [unclassified Mesotoga]MDI9367596.1 ABC transporter ATP-binding protein [Thermotogota bacterium]MDD3681459.1 ABC transporter ATP-binding protein [Mesotoga sp.]MDD4826628.1 ABC transporter ATP-binding protein [Mesotoga sp.]RLL86441.1 multidrug ABC transporter ATP-binding protein [Mesotoga sp. BH458_6_3_2_1]RLL86800.1 multidrug ABC transporter ATP-binding protein [Mesotoga sp. H07pep.5.4]
MPEEKKATQPEVTMPAGPGRGGPGAGRARPVQKPKNSKQTVLRLVGYFRNEKKGLILAIAFTILATGASVFGPFLLGVAIDKYMLVGDMAGLAMISIVMAAVYISSSFFLWLQGYTMVGVAQRSIRRLRQDLFDKFQTLPVKFFDTKPHGELMSRLTNDINNISHTLSESVTQLVSSLLTLVGIVVIMFFLNPILALVAMSTVPFVMIVTAIIAKQSRKNFLAQQKALGELNGYVEERISGAKVVKAYGREESTVQEFQSINESYRRSAIMAQIFAGSFGPIMNMVNNFGYAIVAFAGGWMSVKGILSVGLVASFIVYVGQFNRPINQIAQMFNAIQAALAGAERVFEILDEKGEKRAEETFFPQKIEGEVTLEEVDFSYDGKTIVLKDVSLTAEPGQIIALVGPTGAGKTTIVNLLTKFYDIEDGKIMIDGHDISSFDREQLRRELGIVLQDTQLFMGTIKDNIRYGRQEASDEEIIEAAKMANAHHFIMGLPEGYETVLSSSGDTISRGQRQLLAIARIMLIDPQILILDEATSNVDTRTEMHIQEAMRNLMKDRTSFVVAHRLSTIKNADRIYVIDNGRIIESGTHDELIRMKGFYYSLYTTQLALPGHDVA